MGILNRFLRREKHAETIDYLVETHFKLKIKNRRFYEEAFRHSSAIDGDENGKKSNDLEEEDSEDDDDISSHLSIKDTDAPLKAQKKIRNIFRK